MYNQGYQQQWGGQQQQWGGQQQQWGGQQHQWGGEQWGGQQQWDPNAQWNQGNDWWGGQQNWNQGQQNWNQGRNNDQGGNVKVQQKKPQQNQTKASKDSKDQTKANKDGDLKKKPVAKPEPKKMTQAEMDAFFAKPLPTADDVVEKETEKKVEEKQVESSPKEKKVESSPKKAESPKVTKKPESPKVETKEVESPKIDKNAEKKQEKEDWESDGSPSPTKAGPSSPTKAGVTTVEEKLIEVYPEVTTKTCGESSSANDEDDPLLEGEEGVSKKKTGTTTMQDPDPRPHANIVFIGHVDAGKSTTCGNILYLTGWVDERTIEKYQREAKEKNRDSWFLAYIMDTSEEEKAKGKTVEVGRAQFSTPNKRFTILDAPGHKSYVPNMISGASQADIGVLIISARKGEFETGFEKGGQTSEHAILAKTLGVDKLIIAVNKMDDPSVEWSEERYTEIVEKMRPFIRSTCGFKDDQVVYMPISGLNGDNLKEKKGTPSWVSKHNNAADNQTFFELIDSIDIGTKKKKEGPLRMPMLDGYRDMGALMAIGKIEQGKIEPGMKCLVQPMGKQCIAQNVFIGDDEVSHASVGENITVRMGGGLTEEDLRRGFVLCPQIEPARALEKFKAQFKILDLVEERPILTAGYRCVIHFHTAVEDCEITKLTECITLGKTKKVDKNPKFAKINDVLSCIITLDRRAALDAFTGCEKLGRFTLRDEGRTIGIGKITDLPKEKA